MEMLLFLLVLMLPAVAVFVGADLDRKHQWQGWST